MWRTHNPILARALVHLRTLFPHHNAKYCFFCSIHTSIFNLSYLSVPVSLITELTHEHSHLFHPYQQHSFLATPRSQSVCMFYCDGTTCSRPQCTKLVMLGRNRDLPVSMLNERSAAPR
jgi:hypothetical protein